ncbi:TPA: hypothetical protein DGT35_00225, partial [Patescibacteria group bacterium]|nr:hypothetical protein [Patescibacteria group bacterium]
NDKKNEIARSQLEVEEKPDDGVEEVLDSPKKVTLYYNPYHGDPKKEKVNKVEPSKAMLIKFLEYYFGADWKEYFELKGSKYIDGNWNPDILGSDDVLDEIRKIRPKPQDDEPEPETTTTPTPKTSQYHNFEKSFKDFKLHPNLRGGSSGYFSTFLGTFGKNKLYYVTLEELEKVLQKPNTFVEVKITEPQWCPHCRNSFGKNGYYLTIQQARKIGWEPPPGTGIPADAKVQLTDGNLVIK